MQRVCVLVLSITDSKYQTIAEFIIRTPGQDLNSRQYLKIFSFTLIYVHSGEYKYNVTQRYCWKDIIRVLAR